MSQKKNHKYCVGKNCHEDRHVINLIALIIGIMGPLSSAPQAWMIYTTHDATGVSIWTWLLFLVFNFTMIFYGAVHRLMPIVVSNVTWVVVEIIIIAGILMYS